MRKLLLPYLLLIVLMPGLGLAQDGDGQTRADSVNRSFTYKTGVINLQNGNAKLTVPKGFKYLDAEQSKRVIVDIWGNPEGISTQGMLFPADGGPIGERSWAFNVNYEEMGYVEDKDADDIDYKDLLNDMKEGTVTENEERVKQGYEPITLVDWASTPFYDKQHKVLHWAQELSFGDTSDMHTVNYDVRILGRKGVMSMNAIGTMDEIDEIKANIPGIVGSVAFESGNRYSDFTDGDKLAAVTIGGLVAGKVLAKVGLFALVLKFWKVLLIAIAGGWSVIRRFFGAKTTPSVDSNGELS